MVLFRPRLEQPQKLQTTGAAPCIEAQAVHFGSDAKAMFLERFRSEGAFPSRLSAHPSIVRVFDLNMIEKASSVSVPYLVLEWLDGMELEQQLEDRRRAGLAPMTEDEAIALLRPAVDALAMAHGVSIAHRDLKPANLFLAQTHQGIALKVLDFGIAKAMQEGETATQQATGTSSTFHAFTPNYGAPEQFLSSRFGATGPWTDVYAFGLILSELLLGRRAYEGDSQFALYEEALAATRPTPRAKGANVSDAFEQLCAKALATRPADRYQDAGQLLAAMDQLDQLEQGAKAAKAAKIEPADLSSEAIRDMTPPKATDGKGTGTGTELAPELRDAPQEPTRAGANATAPLAPDQSPMATHAVKGPMLQQPAQVARIESVPTPDAAQLAGQASLAPQTARIPTPPPREDKKRGSATTVLAIIGGVAVAAGVVIVMAKSGGGASGTVSAGSALAAAASASAAAATSVNSAASSAMAPSAAKPDLGEMVRIPAGTFLMGSNDGSYNEKPVHSVSVAAFEMARTEVTVKAYQACVNAGACEARTTVNADWYEKHGGVEKWSQACNYGQADRDTHPMNCVDWHDAGKFCKWAGDKRLPSEEEWEYAARGTDNRKYPWGNDAPTPERLNACGPECVAWFKQNVGLDVQSMLKTTDGWTTTASVGSFGTGASPFGLLDVAGNVWEWTSSGYSNGYEKTG